MGRRKYTNEDLEAIRQQVRERIVDAVGRADAEQTAAGLGWYAVAHEEAKLLADEFGLDVYRTSAIIAVLSPLTRWAGNLEDAWNVVNGDPVRHALPKNAEKARRILAGEDPVDVLGGRKVNSFWMNICGPIGRYYVTFDSWMARLCGLQESDVFNVWGVYSACTMGVWDAARDLELLPLQAQAIAWLVAIEDDRQRRRSHDDDLPTPM